MLPLSQSFSLFLSVFPQFSYTLFLNIQTIIEQLLEDLRRIKSAKLLPNPPLVLFHQVKSENFNFPDLLLPCASFQHPSAHAYFVFIIVASRTRRDLSFFSQFAFDCTLLLLPLLLFSLKYAMEENN